MKKIAVLGITKNGIKIGLRLKEYFPNFEVFAPIKFSDNNEKIQWYDESTSQKIVDLFKKHDGIICLFSLGAVIRLLAPHIKDKKTDPAVIVIDDNANFVISVLSGHLGGANELSNEIAEKMSATSVITTAADVNKTIAVDLVGKKFGWKIDDDSNVTRISAFMVNKEKIGVFQNVGQKEWWEGKLPENITFFSNIEDLKNSDSKGYLIITNDEIENEEVLRDSVVYRVPNLVVGIGLHWDTSKETISNGVNETLEKFGLKQNQIASKVKIADSSHNLSKAHLIDDANMRSQLRNKYINVLNYLGVDGKSCEKPLYFINEKWQEKNIED